MRLQVGMQVYWMSYKIEGKWFEGTIVGIKDPPAGSRKKKLAYIIETSHCIVSTKIERYAEDIKIISP